MSALGWTFDCGRVSFTDDALEALRAHVVSCDETGNYRWRCSAASLQDKFGWTRHQARDVMARVGGMTGLRLVLVKGQWSGAYLTARGEQ